MADLSEIDGGEPLYLCLDEQYAICHAEIR